MAGVNPYIRPPEGNGPKRKYRIKFIFEESKESKIVEVDPAKIPYDRTGQPGSILEIALGNGVGIDHSCGGVCACSTCHVIVLEGLKSCSEATDDELDMVETARGVTTESRLACQCIANGDFDLVVVIPGWNRNLVKEGH
ncbi:MAG TPA: 2Fe-2S iron-sulfur cluster-binding protein [Gemmataceae bacterium]|jgi:2Fe-2S ferredoxin|nr:2Fe-2S iron-sulfur cluster-binding protein [Gemmataceae bacterium]